VIGTLRNLAYDATDHRALVAFYAALTGGEIRRANSHWAVMATSDGWKIGAQPAADFRRSTWPTQAMPQQMHLDILTTDVDAAAARAVTLGATRLGGDAGKLAVMADPDGHPFCLCAGETDSVFGVCLDSDDPAGLAAFYASLLSMSPRGDGRISDGSRNVTFQPVDSYRRPRWPSPDAPQQVHLDVWVKDVDAATAAALDLGARRLDGEGANWKVFEDPSGHPFCLIFDPRAHRRRRT
jgi:hypothetical protein